MIKPSKEIIRNVVVVLAAALICFGLGMWTAGKSGGQAEITTDLISSRIEEISELAVTEYRYTNVGKYENRLDFYGWEVPLTMKRFIISYDGVIRAGVALDQAEVAVKKNGTISVTLPKAEVLSHDIDLDSITVFDETKNIFNPIQITDYVDFSKDQQKGAEEEAIEKGLLTEASDRAADLIKRWLESVVGDGESGGPKVSVTVEE